MAKLKIYVHYMQHSCEKNSSVDSKMELSSEFSSDTAVKIGVALSLHHTTALNII